jgi:hypothetical protein
MFKHFYPPIVPTGRLKAINLFRNFKLTHYQNAGSVLICFPQIQQIKYTQISQMTSVLICAISEKISGICGKTFCQIQIRTLLKYPLRFLLQNVHFKFQKLGIKSFYKILLHAGFFNKTICNTIVHIFLYILVADFLIPLGQ